MEEPRAAIAYPTIDQIIEVNRRMIQEFGGSFSPPTNLINRNSLEYILEAISRPVFGRHLFLSLKDKAAALAFEIIAAHVFIDGNKRTATHTAWEFLRSNQIGVYLDHSVEDIAVAVASRTASRDDLLSWLHSHQTDEDSPSAT